MLESLYEDHGDTLALQYGGSQLVHRIKTYRKTAAWTSQGNDIMQTLSRYLSNTFSDTEKQHSINLFLGYYIPYENSHKGKEYKRLEDIRTFNHKINRSDNAAIWELPTDYYMHNLQTFNDHEKTLTPFTDWVGETIMRNLPNSTSNRNKVVKELIRVHSKELEMIDYYSNYHIPYKWTAFEENIAFRIGHLARNFMPTYRTNFSPFDPSTRGEVRGSLKNPSLTGQSSTSSTTSSTSSSLDEYSSDSDDEQVISNRNTSSMNDREEKFISFATLLSSTMDVYGFEIKQPQRDDAVKYKRYVQMGKLSMPTKTYQFATTKSRNILSKAVTLSPLANYGTDNYQKVKPPIVPEISKDIYAKYITSPQEIYAKNGEPSDQLLKYFQFNFMHPNKRDKNYMDLSLSLLDGTVAVTFSTTKAASRLAFNLSKAFLRFSAIIARCSEVNCG